MDGVVHWIASSRFSTLSEYVLSAMQLRNSYKSGSIFYCSLTVNFFFYTGQWNVGKSRSMPCLNFRGIIYFCLPFWFLLSQEELPLGGCCSVTWAQGRTHWELTRAHTATRCHAYPAGSEVWSRTPAKPGLDQPTLDDPHKSEKWVIIYPEICSCLLCINNCLMIILICVKKKNSPPKKLYWFNAIQIKVVKVSF